MQVNTIHDDGGVQVTLTLEEAKAISLGLFAWTYEHPETSELCRQWAEMYNAAQARRHPD